MGSFLDRAMEIEGECRRILERLSWETEEGSAVSIYRHLMIHKGDSLQTLEEITALLEGELDEEFQELEIAEFQIVEEGSSIRILYNAARGYAKTMEGLLGGYSHLAASVSNRRASEKLILMVARESRELEALRRIIEVFEEMFGETLGLRGG